MGIRGYIYDFNLIYYILTIIILLLIIIYGLYYCIYKEIQALKYHLLLKDNLKSGKSKETNDTKSQEIEDNDYEIDHGLTSVIEEDITEE